MSTKKKWTYKTVEFENITVLAATIEQYVNDGWEYVEVIVTPAIVPDVILFRKQ